MATQVFPSRWTSLGAHQVERTCQVFGKVPHVLQTDVQPDKPVAVVRTILIPAKIVCDSEAGHTRPTVADLEQLERVDEAKHLLFRKLSLKDDRENSCRSGEIPLPELVPRAGFESRMQHKLYLRTFGQPFGDGERRRFNRLQAHSHRF